jgi:hypothetical protein
MIKKLVIFFACAGSLSACATTNTYQNQPIPVNQDESREPQLNTVNIVDKNLQRTLVYKNGNRVTSGKLAVEGVGQTVLNSGTREVWVQLKNLTDYPQNILVRSSWFDKTGRPVDGPSAWSRLSLSQNTGETYKSSSISQEAEAFVVEVQEVR